MILTPRGADTCPHHITKGQYRPQFPWGQTGVSRGQQELEGPGNSAMETPARGE